MNEKNRERMHKFTSALLCAIMLTLTSCATNPISQPSYAYDLYSFDLNTHQMNVVLSLVNSADYLQQNNAISFLLIDQHRFWVARNKFNQTESFVPYHYQYFNCLTSSTKPKEQLLPTKCEYSLNSGQTQAKIQFINFTAPTASYLFNVSSQGIEESRTIMFNSNDKYPLLLLRNKDGSGNMIIIIRNHTHIPWSEYLKTPQHTMQQ